MNALNTWYRKPRAFTLVELLIVVTISLAIGESAIADLLPRPDAAEVEQATKMIQEMFKMELANSQGQKPELPKEFIKLAEEADVKAEQFALLTMARDMAISYRNVATAFEATIAIAERFQPETGGPTDGSEQFKKAQELWNKSEKLKNETQKTGTRHKVVNNDEWLRSRVEAAEWYAYARPHVTGLSKAMCEKRLKAGEVKKKVLPEEKPTEKPVAKSAEPQPIKILQAVWGNNNARADVTDSFATTLGRRKSVSIRTNDLGHDPAPNQSKTLMVSYISSDGTKTTTTFQDFDVVVMVNGVLRARTN
jgi:type II secretory pathway pseudopilin PulG